MTDMVNDAELKNLANKYGTPTFVFDADEIRDRADRIKNILGGASGLCYSIKANPFLIPALMDKVDRFEVCSPGELEISKKYGVPGNMIIYSGVNKGIEDIREAVEYGVYCVTAESVRQYELIRAVSAECQGTIRVLLRLSSKSQFGMSLEDIKSIIERRSDDPRIEIAGLHYFAGTQREKLAHQRAELEELKDVFGELRNTYDAELPLFEYGPGLGHPYFEGDDFSDTLRPLRELSHDIGRASEWSGITVEMGRFFASGCGYYLTRVADKKRSNDRNWCIVDGGINHLNYLGQMMGLKVPVMSLYSENKDEGEWAICGSLCTTNDVLVRSCVMPEPEIGDLLVFHNIGAYAVTEAMGLFLSRDLPRIVIRRDGEDTLVRDTVKTWEINS